MHLHVWQTLVFDAFEKLKKHFKVTILNFEMLTQALANQLHNPDIKEQFNRALKKDQRVGGVEVFKDEQFLVLCAFWLLGRKKFPLSKIRAFIGPNVLLLFASPCSLMYSPKKRRSRSKSKSK